MTRISDFGTARDVKSIDKSMTMTIGVGTPYYMAPEVMTNSKHYSTSIDVYSFGVMAAHVLNDKLEYAGDPEFGSVYGLLLFF